MPVLLTTRSSLVAGPARQPAAFCGGLRLQAEARLRASTAGSTLAGGTVGLGICVQDPGAFALCRGIWEKVAALDIVSSPTEILRGFPSVGL